MALKRKTRNLPAMNDQVSFFDPVYPNEDDENDLLADGIPRPSFRNESNETLGTNTITNDDDQDPSSELMSSSKIIMRIKQIQNSIEQATTMLESMEQFQHLVPGTDEQRQKLYSIISTLEEQQASYTNLLNLISLTEQERVAVLDRKPAFSENNDDDYDNLSLRQNVQPPIRPRIESKIGFILPQGTIHSSDTEQTTRNDNSNYNSLVGSLKSDTITWKDQQSTSDDEASDVELEKNFMLHKEQLRALQGQKRALLAIQRRSEQRLVEQQQLSKKKPTNLNQAEEEDDLLSDINNLRDRLKVLRNLYEQKRQVELHRLTSSSIPIENRLKNLEHIRERLDELEQLVNYYQTDDEPKHLDELSNELTAKRLELEGAKSALSQLQQMVKTIQPEGSSSSAQSTPTSRKSQPKSNEFDTPKSVDAKMVAQHREIERLVESRSRLHNIKDQIASLHQSMTTPPITQSETYEDKLNDARNIRPTYHQLENASQEDNQSDLQEFEFQSEESDDDTASQIPIQPRMKQSNLYASDDLNTQMREICRCLSLFIDEQKSFNRHIEQRLTNVTNSSVPEPADPIFNQLQQQVLAQGLIVNLNTAYREIAVLQSEMNALQSENNRLASSISFEHQYHQRIPRSYSGDNFDQMNPNGRPQPRSRFDEHNRSSEKSSKTSVNSQSTGKQTAIRVTKIPIETTPTKKTAENHRQSITDEDEQQSNDFSTTMFDIQPSAYSNQVLDNVDIQTLDLQIKSIMVQLIPYMRLHINEIFNQPILNHIRERMLFLLKQQPDSSQMIRHSSNQFSQLLENTIEKYCGTSIRECAADLIRDISDLTFDELVKYKTNEDLELETAVPRPGIIHREHPISTELHSNGHEYILVNGSMNNHLVPGNENEH